MPIHPSSSAEIRRLVDALGSEDAVTRESAIARLAVIGARAVEHLLQEFPAAPPLRRVGILRAFEALGDPRAVPLARAGAADASPDHAMAAIGVLRAFLNAPQPAVAADALDAVVATALDRARPAGARLAALEALRALPADVREAVRKNLAEDADPDVRARASAAAMTPSDAVYRDDDVIWAEAVGGTLPKSPLRLKQALAAKRSSARLTDLQHLVDHLRMHEHREIVPERREEWRAIRGAVHQALAARNSRLALYDLRDSLLEPERLPVAFLAALEEIGDATCLETLAAAYEASSRSGDAWWREHVAAAFRAIVAREGLTRRHAALKRAIARWPEAAADLLSRK